MENLKQRQKEDVDGGVTCRLSILICSGARVWEMIGKWGSAPLSID